MPPAADDPFPGLRLFDGARHLIDNFVPRPRLAQIEPHAKFADAGEVSMPFDESGNGEHAVKVDDLGVGPDPLRRLVIRAERRYSVTAHRYGLCHRPRGTHRYYLAVAQDQIRRL